VDARSKRHNVRRRHVAASTVRLVIPVHAGLLSATHPDLLEESHGLFGNQETTSAIGQHDVRARPVLLFLDDVPDAKAMIFPRRGTDRSPSRPHHDSESRPRGVSGSAD